MLKPLPFELSSSLYSSNLGIMEQNTLALKRIVKTAGTESPQFRHAWERLSLKLQSDNFEEYQLKDRFDVRALAVALQAKKLTESIAVSNKLLGQVNSILKTPSTLFIDALFQHFLVKFDAISDTNAVGKWLVEARKLAKIDDIYDAFLLNPSGPAWLAKTAIADQTPLHQQIQKCGISNFAAGDFVKRAHDIYYVEQLQQIPVNQEHEILYEVCKKDVYEARYDDNKLLGHVILETLIKRAPQKDISPAWQNVIIEIAGDPRIPNHHPRFVKWWSHLPIELVSKVKGWLSKFDLKLFLDALEDLSLSSVNTDMMRMYPSRKNFLEGMYDSGAIIETKLFLSRSAESYIKKNYKPEHRPAYSLVTDGNISVIYAKLVHGHMIEGSHNCKIWFYDQLPSNAYFFDYQSLKLKYSNLTTGFYARMSAAGFEPVDYFSHVPANFKWQHNALVTLNRMGVNVRAADVLSGEDYQRYKRIYGVY